MLIIAVGFPITTTAVCCAKHFSIWTMSCQWPKEVSSVYGTGALSMAPESHKGFWCVYRRGHQWVAEAFEQQLGVRNTDKEAAEVVRKAFGLRSISDLQLLPHCAPVRVPCLKGVYYRKPGKRSSGGWWALKERYFPTVEQAASYVAKRKGLTVRDLHRPLGPKAMRRRFRTLSKVFSPCPGDLQDAVAFCKVAGAMFKDCPVLTPISYQAKYGPWRGALLEAWKEQQGEARCPLSSVGEQARTAVVVMESAAIYISAMQAKSNVLRPWTASCGRGGQHISGFVPLAQSLGIIEKATRFTPEAEDLPSPIQF